LKVRVRFASYFAKQMLHGGKAAASRERERVLHYILPLHRFYAIIGLKVEFDERKTAFCENRRFV